MIINCTSVLKDETMMSNNNGRRLNDVTPAEWDAVTSVTYNGVPVEAHSFTSAEKLYPTSYDRFKLEDKIMACWGVVDDLDSCLEYIIDHPDFEGMSDAHADKIFNIVNGVKSLYDVKFNTMWEVFEACVAKKEF